jgi:DNA-binding response OmpR family regulator
MEILVVEDEAGIADFLERGLESEGYGVTVAEDGVTGQRLALDAAVDLVVLDRMLPGRDGLEVLGAIRRAKPSLPVILLTARAEVADRVEGLDLGATDYLTKPFAFEELLARVRALLRRGSERRAPVLRLADLTLDPATRKVERAGRRIELTTREWALLEYFMRNAGRILTRPMLVQHVWGLDFDPESNIVDVYVGYLRRKIDGPQEQKLFHTIRGAGYVVKDEP